jgi:hypothetical protein
VFLRNPSFANRRPHLLILIIVHDPSLVCKLQELSSNILTARAARFPRYASFAREAPALLTKFPSYGRPALVTSEALWMGELPRNLCILVSDHFTGFLAGLRWRFTFQTHHLSIFSLLDFSHDWGAALVTSET